MDCPSCGHANRDTAKFCDECGRPLAAAGARAPADPRAYTPRHLVERILTGRAALEGERKQVTVLFADIQDSMLLAERLGAEAWHRLLDRFFHLLAEGVHRFEGTINQYTGDGVMALFGAPLGLEDHAQRACHAALALRDQLAAFAAELAQRNGPTLAVRMGLNSGEVVVGRIGDDLRMDYTAQGHTVGIAQRVEQLAAPNTACIAQATQALVADAFELRDLGAHAVKGVRELVRVYALERPRPAQARIEAALARSPARMVGRAGELAELERALDDAMAGYGQVVGVVGEAGVGKTRLCLELLRRCRARGATVAQAHCPSHAASVAFLPVLELLRSLFGVAADEPAQAGRGRIRDALDRITPGGRDALALVCDFLQLPDPDHPLLLLEEQRRARVAAFLRRLVQAHRAVGPLVLFVDDLHWVDGDGEALLGEVADALGWTPTLLLLNFRPGYRAAWMQVPYYRELPLAALSDEATDTLLRRLIGDHASTADLRRLIRERTAGNPFFVEEIVRSLIDDGALADAGGARGRRRLALRQPVAELSIPATIQALLAARLDRLPERDKLVLQAAAVIGPSFAPALLRHALSAEETGAGGIDGEAVDAALAALERAEFIRRDTAAADRDCTFKHPLTQAVAYGSQLAEARARLHVAVARSLQALHADRLGQHAALLAHHFAAANWTFEATRWRRRAALRVTSIELGRRPRR
ncbi:MAG TPA: AAA family ATPase [Candidatus Dormibacteraeota bacterium]|nr:AAA family ATPase [Candidatus Dormibacteraeota bacterium]